MLQMSQSTVRAIGVEAPKYRALSVAVAVQAVDCPERDFVQQLHFEIDIREGLQKVL